MDRIDSTLKMLAHSPAVGERCPELGSGKFRRMSAGNYVIYFEPVEDGILFIRVLHGARDHGPLLP